MSRDAVRAYLADTLDQFGPDPIVIIPDPTTTFDTVAQFLRDIKSLGCTRCSVIANQRRLYEAYAATQIDFSSVQMETIEWSVPPTNAP